MLIFSRAFLNVMIVGLFSPVTDCMCYQYVMMVSNYIKTLCYLTVDIQALLSTFHKQKNMHHY